MNNPQEVAKVEGEDPYCEVLFPRARRACFFLDGSRERELWSEQCTNKNQCPTPNLPRVEWC